MTPPRMLSSSATVGLVNHPCKRFSLDSNIAPTGSQTVQYGLLITLRKTEDGNGSQVELTFCPDDQYPDIHPNAYAPAEFENMHKLGGGGSGVAVFEGTHPILGDVVMKHGGDKDLKELFALATIAEELKARGNANPTAAQYLQERIPEFRMIYISPHHLGEKRRELWYKLTALFKNSSRNLLVLPEDEELETTELTKADSVPFNRQDWLRNSTGSPFSHFDDNSGGSEFSPKSRRKHDGTRHVPSHPGLNMSQSGTVSGHRSIAIYDNNNDGDSSCSVELLGDSLTFSIPPCGEEPGDGLRDPIIIPGNGYQVLKSIVGDLNNLMKEHKWKLTLGQKRIGGPDPKTGNIWLYAGVLEGALLDNLIRQKIQLVRVLATLTTLEEKDPKFIREVRCEVARFEEEENLTPRDLSTLSDNFVGNAIKKNFQMGTGRFAILAQLGRQFREFIQANPELKRRFFGRSCLDGGGTQLPALLHNLDDLFLTPEEEIPAHHLGCLTRMGALMGDTFENVPLEPTILEMSQFHWRNLLRAAIQPRRQHTTGEALSMALTRIWTCGLTDAGLHNLFLTEDSLWFFDLGQPQLYSAPGFLTKFLFSFFHTLGMEETKDGTGDWVRRFEHNSDTNKLRLTAETKTLLAKAYTAFETTLDQMIDQLFDRDDSLRWLLVQYVTLQLLSDASFCLQRWKIKGGGRTRDANHQKGIEKWLWRALWDMYVAYDINTSETWSRLNVEHPSDRDSVFYSDMRDLIMDDDFITSAKLIDELDTKCDEQFTASS